MDGKGGIAEAVAALPRSRRGGSGMGPLELLGRQRHEDSHERYLAFLLDPRTGHGLGAGLLGALLTLAGRPELADAPGLVRAGVHRQVRGASSRPDLIVTWPGGSLLVELKVDSREGHQQTTRQGDDFADLHEPVFVYLTPGGRPAGDGRFRPVSLRDLAGHLARLLETAGTTAPGRRHADDYLSDLESTVGISTDDDEDARLWLTHSTAMLAAQEATRRLLRQLAGRVLTEFEGLAAELGEGVVVSSFPYEAAGKLGTYPETAVLLSRPQWLEGGEVLLGFGFGVRCRTSQKHPGPDPDDWRFRPFHGIYCADSTVRSAVTKRFATGDWGGCWGWSEQLPLPPHPEGVGFLDHHGPAVAALVRRAWQDRIATVDALWAEHRAS
ncbi:hypothetical protein [Kitasatospora sp. NPDC101183]|uniref:hypothetical protein n=1 Tax=Kitasatospora sp. NPDC101183 TaxID=3364100 RepID=UPI003824790D